MLLRLTGIDYREGFSYGDGWLERAKMIASFGSFENLVSCALRRSYTLDIDSLSIGDPVGCGTQTTLGIWLGDSMIRFTEDGQAYTSRRVYATRGWKVIDG